MGVSYFFCVITVKFQIYKISSLENAGILWEEEFAYKVCDFNTLTLHGTVKMVAYIRFLLISGLLMSRVLFYCKVLTFGWGFSKSCLYHIIAYIIYCFYRDSTVFANLEIPFISPNSQWIAIK